MRQNIAGRFADETASQRAQHLEIARRYSWDDRDRPDRRRPNVRLNKRFRELERFYAYQYGETLPEDDGGRDDLLVAAHHIAQFGSSPDQRIAAWARRWAPWLSDDECTVLIERVARKALRWTADTLAWRIGLNDATRTLLRITTIGAIDCNKAEREQRRQLKNKAAKTARRRKAGAVDRAQYEAASAARARPWEAFGISRATWHRRGRPQPVKPAQTSETGPGTAENRPMLSPQLSHATPGAGGSIGGKAKLTQTYQPRARRLRAQAAPNGGGS